MKLRQGDGGRGKVEDEVDFTCSDLQNPKVVGRPAASCRHQLTASKEKGDNVEKCACTFRLDNV